MKMNVLFGPAFWGILIVLLGLSIILKQVGVNLPLVKMFIAIVIILFGVRLLVGGSCSIRTRSTRSGVYTTGSTEHSVVFSSQTIDLTGISVDSRPLELTAVFGSAYVLLPEDIEFDFESTSVFGSVEVPRKPDSTQVYPKGRVSIEASAVFGKIEFAYKPATRQQTAQADTIYVDPGDTSE
jgi:predicted membrane protein